MNPPDAVPVPAVHSAEEAHVLANECTVQGIALLVRGDEEALLEALECFERAISLRKDLPLEAHPIYRWGLTAGWMNRGDVLTRLGGRERLQLALQSYDTAIAHLHRLPLQADPIFRWRLCVAWMNRGMTEQAMGGASAAERALRCFDNAIHTLRGCEDQPRPDYQEALACAWMNRANTLLQFPVKDAKLAAAAARRSMAHSQACMPPSPLAAEAGIKARHVLCQALAHLLEAPEGDMAEADDWLMEVSDAVEDVMRLTQGEARFTAVREDVFRLGCLIYRAFQPHFLAEFLDEGLDSGNFSPLMRKAAHQSLIQAAGQIQHEKLAGYTPARLDRLLQTLQALSLVRQKLAVDHESFQ